MVEQCFGILQIGGVEALGEPAVGRREEITGFGAFALISPEAREAGGGAELNRQKGRLLWRRGNPEAAEEFYRTALSIAEEQEAKLWELRAAASLARLWRDQGKRGKARDLLAPVYGWFTEGFDTPDLKQARALLDELA